jgi:hypothetical protein
MLMVLLDGGVRTAHCEEQRKEVLTSSDGVFFNESKFVVRPDFLLRHSTSRH